MIPRIQSGTSFKGVGLYYLHDKRAKGEDERLTTERVAWTHAVNTMEDEPEAVLTEMSRTARNQGLLKRLAGKREVGRPTEDTVTTVALSWSPDQHPDREEMIEAGMSFLKHMGWDEQQVLMVAHDDTKHPHIHLIINRVHPETGMTLDDNWSKRRAQRWALAYEREHGQVLCKAREAKYDHDRPANDHMNYREWQEWQKLSRDHAIDPEFQQGVAAGEWDVLKKIQKQERVGFWKDTSRIRKEMRQHLREEVREEFKEEWQDYALLRQERAEQAHIYDSGVRRELRRLRQAGNLKAIARTREKQDDYHRELRKELADMRKDISDRQKARFEEIAVPTLEDFKNERLHLYQDVLARHRAERAQLHDDQAEGTRRRDLLGRLDVSERAQQKEAEPERREDGEERRPAADKRSADYRFYTNRYRASRERDVEPIGRQGGSGSGEKPPRRDGIDLVAGAGLSLIGRIAESLETLFDTPPPPADQQEKRAMDKDRDHDNRPAPHPNVEQQRKDQEHAEQDAKLKTDQEFYNRRRAERGFDRDR